MDVEEFILRLRTGRMMLELGMINRHVLALFESGPPEYEPDFVVWVFPGSPECN
jgi:hypothetical protein